MKIIKKGSGLLIRDNVLNYKAVCEFLDSKPYLTFKSSSWYHRNKNADNYIYVPLTFVTAMQKYLGTSWKLNDYAYHDGVFRLHFENNNDYNYSLEMIQLDGINEDILKYKYE